MAGDKFKFFLGYSRYITSRRLLDHFKKASYKSGYLMPNFRQFRMQRSSKVCFAHNQKRKFAGWGFLFKEDGDFALMLFVKKEFRRQGVGTEIVRLLSKGLTEIETRPHDNKSRKFFKKIKESSAGTTYW